MIRYMLSRRWWAWHALWFIAVVGCIWLAVWQFQAAAAPHPAGADTQSWRNFAYGLNWLVFAGVAVWFWWRFIRDQRDSEQAAARQPADAPAGPAMVEQPADAPAGQQTVMPGAQRVFDPFAAAEPPAVDDRAQR